MVPMCDEYAKKIAEAKASLASVAPGSLTANVVSFPSGKEREVDVTIEFGAHVLTMPLSEAEFNFVRLRKSVDGYLDSVRKHSENFERRLAALKLELESSLARESGRNSVLAETLVSDEAHVDEEQSFRP
jgi:hypothetical protein